MSISLKIIKEMTVNIINNYNKEIKFNFSINNLSNKIFNYILKVEKFPKDLFINVYLVNNYKIKKLNNSHRGIDKTTDVLSFPMIEFNINTNRKNIIKIIHKNLLLKDYELNEYLLGDIVISIDKVISQSKRYNHSIKREYSFLLTHSILHLLGYDHIDDERIMFDKQDLILKNLGINR